MIIFDDSMADLILLTHKRYLEERRFLYIFNRGLFLMIEGVHLLIKFLLILAELLINLLVSRASTLTFIEFSPGEGR